MLPPSIALSYAVALLCSLSVIPAGVSAADGADAPPWDDYHHFKTEPHFRAHHVRIENQTENNSLLAPGYIFIATFPAPWDPLATGPQIIDQQGNHVYFGVDETDGRAQNFHVCNFMGESGRHICWSEADLSPLAGIRTWSKVFDSSYRMVGRPYGSALGRLRFPDPHEFQITREGKTVLQGVFEHKEIDLTLHDGPNPGYVYDGCFQEEDLEIGKEVFSWCMLDHGVHFEDGYVPLNDGYGTGTVRDPWDYAHINAVDKNAEGDYYISIRHLNAIFKIAGWNSALRPGTVIWRLGGKHNDFEGEDTVLDLSRQHHVREIALTDERTTLSVFNNQATSQPDLAPGVSSAALVILNNKTMKVEHVQKFHNPDGFTSLGQGSASVLPNGNMFVGWGTVPWVTEFSSDGAVLSHMRLASYRPDQGIDGGVVNYRAYKAEWVGRPSTPPKLLAYTLSCEGEGPLYAYVSWNGATEVRRYRFCTSQVSQHGPWISAGSFDRQGFETKARLRDYWGNMVSFRRWVMVQALDSHGHVMGKTSGETFVPDATKREECDADECQPADYDYPRSQSCVEDCAQGRAALIYWAALVGVLVVLELGISLVQRFFFSWGRGDDGRDEYIELNG